MSLAYHATRNLGAVLTEGLKPMGNLPDICLAEHPYLGYAFFGESATTLIVDVTGLPVEWELGEGRLFEPIPPERLEVMDPQPCVGHFSGWADPAERGNHSASLRRYEAVEEMRA